MDKMHNDGVPQNHKVSSTNSVTYKVVKHLAAILLPLVTNTPQQVHNSQDFADKVKQIKIDKDQWKCRKKKRTADTLFT